MAVIGDSAESYVKGTSQWRKRVSAKRSVIRMRLLSEAMRADLARDNPFVPYMRRMHSDYSGMYRVLCDPLKPVSMDW